MTYPSNSHHERSDATRPHSGDTQITSASSSSHLQRLQPQTAEYHLPPYASDQPIPPTYSSRLSPYPTPGSSASSPANMSMSASLPSNDMIAARMPAMYNTAPTQSPRVRSDRPMDYDPRAYPQDRRDPSGRPRESVRYDPYQTDRRRVSGRETREEKIVLPPPSMAGLRLPDDPYAPKHVLPSIQNNPSTWIEGQAGRTSPLPPVQLPSLRAISGDEASAVPSSRAVAPPPPPPSSSSRQYERPMVSPRDSYRGGPPIDPALTRSTSYSSHPPHPSQYHARPYEQPPHSASHRSYPQGYQHQPLPPPLPPSRKTHPPPHDPRGSPPIRVKYEPDISPPLRQAPLPRNDSQYYGHSPPRYSSDQPGYPDRRGSVISVNNGEGKEPVVGQTRRLAHLMSEQKRRESINTGFGALRSALPLALPTDSKAIILRKALARIEQLERAAGISPTSATAHSYQHMVNDISSPPTARADWRNNGTLHPHRMDERLSSGTPHSSNSSRQPREQETGRYDEWVNDRMDNTPYGGSQGSDGYAIMPVDDGKKRERDHRAPRDQRDQRDREREISGSTGNGSVKRRWVEEDAEEDEEEGDDGSVYSQEKPPSRESHVR